MDNLHGRKPVVAKKKIIIPKEGSLLHILLMWCCVLSVTPFLISRCYIKKNLKKYCHKQCTVSGFRHGRLPYERLLHHIHILQLKQEFLKSIKVTVLPHPPYSPDLGLSDFFLINHRKFLKCRHNDIRKYCFFLVCTTFNKNYAYKPNISKRSVCRRMQQIK